jgi:hypothetical protein
VLLVVLSLPGPPGDPPSDDSLTSAVAASMHLSRSGAVDLLARQERLNRAAGQIGKLLGDSEGGAWIDQGARHLMVNITDARSAALVRREGGEPRLVGHTLKDLEQVEAEIAKAAPSGTPGSASWYVDSPADRVRLEVSRDLADSEAGRTFLAGAWRMGSAVSVDIIAGSPRHLDSVRGGEEIEGHVGVNTEQAQLGTKVATCSAGVWLQDLRDPNHPVNLEATAGHCLVTAPSWVYNNKLIGDRVPGKFPEDPHDWGMIRFAYPGFPLENTPSTRITVPRSPDRDPLLVDGASRVVPGSIVCKAGWVTGDTCGTVDADPVGLRITRPTGITTVLRDLVRTSWACGKPGDSGGPVFDPLGVKGRATVQGIADLVAVDWNDPGVTTVGRPYVDDRLGPPEYDNVSQQCGHDFQLDQDPEKRKRNDGQMHIYYTRLDDVIKDYEADGSGPLRLVTARTAGAAGSTGLTITSRAGSWP